MTGGVRLRETCRRVLCPVMRDRTHLPRGESGTRSFVRGLLRLFLATSAVVVEAGNFTDVHPYLLFSTQQSIYKHILNGTSSTTSEVLTPSPGIVGLSYHLRFGTMFWANGHFRRPAILSAGINGSDVRELISDNLGEPADLEVDWINDRLYWVDRSLRQVSEYDLVTGHRSVVLSTGEPGSSVPSALALYPYPNYGWVYWSDGNKLNKASVTGDDRSTLRSNLDCVNVLTIDYASVTIYWIDYCLYEIQSLRLDGDATTHSYPVTAYIFFASGLVIKNDTFYWSDQDGVFETRNTTGATVRTIYDVPRGSRATGLQLVHSTVQPQGADFVEIIAPANTTSTFTCSPECVNGSCIPPGLCACSTGWRGGSCNLDANECDRQKGGCEYECHNAVGSYYCACPVGYMLTDDHHTCEDVDECSAEERGSCQQVCINQPGTFICSCNPGFILGSDGVSCGAESHHTSVEPTGVMMTPSAEGSLSTEEMEMDKSQNFNLQSATGSITPTASIMRQSSTTVEVYTSEDPKMMATMTGKIATPSFTSTSSSIRGVGSSSSEELAVIPTPLQSVTISSQTSTIAQPQASPSTKAISPGHSTTPAASSPGTSHAGSDRKTSQTLPFSSPQTSRLLDSSPTTGIHAESSSTPLPTFTPDLEVEVASSKKDSGERTIIIATVSLVTICLIIAIVALLITIVAVRKRRRRNTGSYTPEQQRHTSMTLNLSVKRISSSFSYTSKP